MAFLNIKDIKYVKYQYQNIKFQKIKNSKKMQNWQEEFKKLITQLNIVTEGYDGKETIGKQEQKKLKKRLKKYGVEKEDTTESAVDKTKKILDEIYKNYELASKQFSKYESLKTSVQSSKTERDNSLNQLKVIEGLQKQFRAKYDDILKSAQEIEKKEQEKRKTLIEELQKRIKTVQEEYETAGKIKIQRYRQNQTLKHELATIEPKAATTQSLMQAQLKKKEIEIQIQMTTLRQKIQMMSNFKKMGQQTKEKLDNAVATNNKIETRLSILQGKQNENKIVVARAHLVLQEYKKSITRINQLLSKHQKEAIKAQEALRKKRQSAQDVDKGIEKIEKQCEAQRGQIQILLNLQENLKKQLAQ